MCVTDANLGGASMRYDVPGGCKSTSCVQWWISGGVFSQTVRKQPTVALSTMESEAHAISVALNENEVVMATLGELGYGGKDPTKLYCDNNSAVKWANGVGNVAGRRGVRHLELRYAKIREAIQNRLAEIIHVPGEENTADIGTKITSPAVFRKLSKRIIG